MAVFLDVKQVVDDALLNFGPKGRLKIRLGAANAMNKAAKSVAGKAGTLIARTLGKAVKKKYISKQITVTRKAKQEFLQATVTAKHAGLGGNFNPVKYLSAPNQNPKKWRSRPVTSPVYSGKSVTYNRAFLIKAKFGSPGDPNVGVKGFVLVRATGDKSAETVKGPSIPQTFVNKKVLPELQKHGVRRFIKEFEGQLRWRMGFKGKLKVTL